MSNGKIDKLIINSPYEEPTRFWQYERAAKNFTRETGRRPAGYIIANPKSKGHDDPGIFIPIELVNAIRPRVK
ncbi:MAG: hypothetical protein PHD57_13480, partial [Desulfobacterales bacterium]|nr:hypothetical protein [Desulfobacterales bacterium]